MNKKVIIVEDEALIARDLKSKMTKLGFDVIDIIYNSDKVTDALTSKKPDLILLDINIKGSRSGIDIAHIVNKEFQIPFVFVTSYSDSKTIQEVKQTRPAGYIVKPFEMNDLRVELEMALFRIEQNTKLDFPDEALINKNLTKALSTKEFEILLDIRDGLNNTELAKKHFVSVNTIKSHVKNIYLKCEVHNRVELMNFCYGLI